MPARLPRSYTTICVSLYYDDLKAIDGKVDELKRLGCRGVNRSALFRYMAARLDVAAIPSDAFRK